jgi:alpha-mannosidase
MIMSPKRIVHLLCNAHIDPVWLWEWEEGAATAISTFRTSADLCEAFPGFIFNHNEVIVYRWVEEYEPELFTRIQRLVKEGKWHIMGGWYLQPDCNMPSGESFVRQILLGRRYFAEKFGARPTTAINFDPFGHTRGLVQIMAKSGYDSYLFCRPGAEDCRLEADEFIWEGYDGGDTSQHSRVLGHRVWGWYNSPLGKAREKAENFVQKGPQTPAAIMLWGVGDHGGGPSQKDVADLTAFLQEISDSDQGADVEVRHSTPEAYFSSLKARIEGLPIHRKDLNPWAVGCYTSMIRIKQKHRLLENELYATEKMASAAWARNQMTYPKEELDEALYDLATCEFHDILPGSSIQPVEEMALRIFDHGLENLSRVKARAFFALARGQPAAREGEVPVLVYNPHPFAVKGVVECEFQIHDFNWGDSFTDVAVCQAGNALPTQVEKEVGNLNLDWRKRVAFTAELAPSQMNRFDCRLTRMARKPAPQLKAEGNAIHFKTADIEVLINTTTGLIDRYRVGDIDYLDKNASCPLVMRDYPDPWGMLVRRFRDTLGNFSLLPVAEGQRFSGVINPGLPAVRVIEDGAVRSVVEAVLGYADSRLVLRYKLPKRGSEIEIEVRVHWNEKDRMLKLSLPTPDKASIYMGQIAYGVDELPSNGDEVVAQKWVAVVSKSHDTALTIINDGIYGSDFSYGEARLSLLRSPAYSGHPISERPIVPLDRYSPRIDQGERLYHFWLNGGPRAERLLSVDREALAHNEKPMALSFFPVGGDAAPQPFVTLTGEAVQITALKKAETGEGLILRLFNPTTQGQTTKVNFATTSREVALSPFEIRTYRVDSANDEWMETNLIEEPT